MMTFLLRAACIASCLASAPAFAQERRGWTVTLGPGIAYEPQFPGARDMGPTFWPLISVRRTGTEREFTTPDDSAGFSIVGDRRFRIGPSFEIERGREEEDAIPGIGDVGTTIEGGAFAEAYLGDHFRLRADVRKGFNGHKGVTADIGGDLISGTPGDRFHASIGPRLRFANGRYVRAFFGVNPEQSALTGLPVYEAGGGFHSAGALTFAEYRLSEAIGVLAYGRYDRLMGDAKDSPLVLSEVGSRDQYEAGLGLTYTFNLR